MSNPNVVRRLSAMLALCLLFSFATAFAQSVDDNNRLRVGLVLGGGGARGAAHIGVLKELERLQIPIDAIAGTSMGAIVGGLYASGMTVDELAQLVLSLDWTKALSDTPPRSNLSLRRKLDDERFPVDLELGIRDGALVLPRGVIQGQNLHLVLRNLTADVAHISDFDELPTPFRAVASDIERGEAHVMGKGDLARSIRASMSVPGAIAPVRLDGKLLVDGGLVANLPIDVIRDMNVDVIIAVDVEFPLYAPEELQSATAITEQMLTILTRKETLRQIETLGSSDILIRPDLGTFSSSNFSAAAKAIEIGLSAIDEVEDRLAELAVEDAAYADYIASRTRAADSNERLSFVRINHDGRLSSELLASRLAVFAGDSIDAQHLADGASRLYGLDLYEQVSYRIIDEEGQIGVEYTAVAKSWGPDFLNFGISVQDDFDGSTAFNVFARLTKTGLNSRGAEWRTDLQLGTDLGLQSEFYQPFGSGLKYFVAPRLDWRQNNQNVFIDKQSVGQLRVAEGEVGVDLGAELGTIGEIRVGLYSGNGEARIKIGDPAYPDLNFDTGGIFAQLQFDTFDDPRFPRKGVKALFRWDASDQSLGADQNYDVFNADLLSAWSRGKSTLQLGLSYSTTFDTDDQLQEYMPMGGFLRLSGLEHGRISGPHTAIGRLIYYRLVSDYTGGLFEVPIYLGGSIEAGNAWQTRSDMNFDSLIANGSLFAAFDTYIGAIYIAAGFAEGGERTYYLSIGSPPR
ncbi:MAG: patatin-like phospholipase family protein [Woeseiaceae bacterium]